MLQWRSAPVSIDSGAPAAWHDLYNRCARSPLLHPDFLAAALSVFGVRQNLRLFTCARGNELVAAAVMQPTDLFRMRTFQPSQAPIGFWLQRPDLNIHTLLDGLRHVLHPAVVCVSITQQDPSLLARATSPRLSPTDYVETARITIDKPWSTYWKERGSNLRHNLKRTKKKLDAAGKAYRVRLLTDVTDMREAVRVYGKIESNTWKAAGGTAVSADNEQGRFYTELLKRFASRGKARCYQLLIDDEVVATDLCVCGDDEIVVLKTTFDEKYSEYSPAFLMREAVFEQLFGEIWCKRIEFYGRVMDWHRRWTDEMRCMFHLSYFRYEAVLRLRQVLSRLTREDSQPGVPPAIPESTVITLTGDVDREAGTTA